MIEDNLWWFAMIEDNNWWWWLMIMMIDDQWLTMNHWLWWLMMMKYNHDSNDCWFQIQRLYQRGRLIKSAFNKQIMRPLMFDCVSHSPNIINYFFYSFEWAKAIRNKITLQAQVKPRVNWLALSNVVQEVSNAIAIKKASYLFQFTGGQTRNLLMFDRHISLCSSNGIAFLKRLTNITKEHGMESIVQFTNEKASTSFTLSLWFV